jgi:hypothetical protein
MIGNQVRVLLTDTNNDIGGVLKELDSAGATVYRTDGLPDQNRNLFIPMSRIKEIQDYGRPSF